MTPFQQRVTEEKRELDTRLHKLESFIYVDQLPSTFSTLPPGEQSRLRIQLRIMQAYSTILGERIAHFE